MTPKRSHLPSPAMLVALTALVLALGGTSYAAINLASNSVGTKHLKRNAVIGAKVKNRSLKAVDFALGQLPRGAQGIQGPQGPAGPAGQAGATNVTVRVGPEASPRSTASCLAGERAVGGGGFTVDGFLYDSSPSVTEGTPTDWQAAAGLEGGGDGTAQAYVICASP